MRNIYDIIWEDWHIERTLGQGSYGVVYMASKQGFNSKVYSAIKHMSIPSSANEADKLKREGRSTAQVREYYADIVRHISDEIRLMDNFKGQTNIVSIEDFRIIETPGEIGWDILIRMELLEDLDKYFDNKAGSIADIVQVGIDICNALEDCEKENIIHRDIKPENIFVNKRGHYKLGDFGIAREYSANSADMSMRGTLNYVAPEINQNKPYDLTVDIYSLGIVLYRLLNNYRLPFIPMEGIITQQQETEALSKRLYNQEKFNPPVNSIPALSEIIYKATAYEPSERYQNAKDFGRDLRSVLMVLNKMSDDEVPKYNYIREEEQVAPVVPPTYTQTGNNSHGTFVAGQNDINSSGTVSGTTVISQGTNVLNASNTMADGTTVISQGTNVLNASGTMADGTTVISQGTNVLNASGTMADGTTVINQGVNAYNASNNMTNGANAFNQVGYNASSNMSGAGFANQSGYIGGTGVAGGSAVQAQQNKKPNSKLIIIIVAAIVLFAVVVAGAFALGSRSGGNSEVEGNVVASDSVDDTSSNGIGFEDIESDDDNVIDQQSTTKKNKKDKTTKKSTTTTKKSSGYNTTARQTTTKRATTTRKNTTTRKSTTTKKHTTTKKSTTAKKTTTTKKPTTAKKTTTTKKPTTTKKEPSRGRVGGISMSKSGSNVKVSWGSASGASEYLVETSAPGGFRSSTRTSSTSANIMYTRSGTYKVTVTPVFDGEVDYSKSSSSSKSF